MVLLVGVFVTDLINAEGWNALVIKGTYKIIPRIINAGTTTLGKAPLSPLRAILMSPSHRIYHYNSIKVSDGGEAVENETPSRVEQSTLFEI
jgi:hypothetical protein